MTDHPGPCTKCGCKEYYGYEEVVNLMDEDGDLAITGSNGIQRLECVKCGHNPGM